jgi:hypothetical protein
MRAPWRRFRPYGERRNSPPGGLLRVRDPEAGPNKRCAVGEVRSRQISATGVTRQLASRNAEQPVAANATFREQAMDSDAAVTRCWPHRRRQANSARCLLAREAATSEEARSVSKSMSIIVAENPPTTRQFPIRSTDTPTGTPRTDSPLPIVTIPTPIAADAKTRRIFTPSENFRSESAISPIIKQDRSGDEPASRVIDGVCGNW